MKNQFSNSDQYIAKLRNVEQLIAATKLQSAALELNKLSKASPNDPRLFLLGARLAEASGNSEGVVKAARKAVSLRPEWPAAIIYLASILADRTEFNEAVLQANQAVFFATTQGSLNTELLTSAAFIAHRARDDDQTLEWLRQAEELAPTDSSIQYKIGLALSASGNYQGAIDVFTSLLAAQPNNPVLLSARRTAAIGAEDTTLAMLDSDVLLSLDPEDEVNKYYSAFYRGETPTTQPASMIASIYDDLAVRLSQQKVAQLPYKMSSEVAELIKTWYPDGKVDVLDLGCGTGLLGQFLPDIKGALVGVDLSERMLALANQRNAYHSFHQVNVIDALQATPEKHYDVIVALDVFTHVGNLDDAIPGAFRILTPGGHFIFSCDAASEDQARFYVQQNFRYAHQESYLRQCLSDAGFQNVKFETQVMRLGSSHSEHGFLVTAQKSI